MGSVAIIGKTGQRGGKVESRLAEMEAAFLADGGSWKEFKLGDLFEFKAIKQAKSQSSIPTDESNFGVNYVIQSTFNNMIARKVSRQWLIDNYEAPVSGNKIVLGVTLPAVSYQPDEFGASQVITASADWLNPKIGLFIVTLIKKLMYQFSYSQKPGMQIYKNMQIMLPEKNNAIAFDYMERFVQQLHAFRVQLLNKWLKMSNLSDVNLSKDEENALAQLSSSLKPFAIKDLFNQITQGERVTKAEQISGSLNFVMSGVTNTGVVRQIGNAVQKFPENSITIDIFGNVFYRNYEFGASDDVGVYWNTTERKINKHAMLYLAASLQKSMTGRFDYGFKLRASKSHNLTCMLPEKNGKPDIELMAKIGRAVEKLVIADVAAFTKCEIAAYQTIVA